MMQIHLTAASVSDSAVAQHPIADTSHALAFFSARNSPPKPYLEQVWNAEGATPPDDHWATTRAPGADIGNERSAGEICVLPLCSKGCPATHILRSVVPMRSPRAAADLRDQVPSEDAACLNEEPPC